MVEVTDVKRAMTVSKVKRKRYEFAGVRERTILFSSTIGGFDETSIRSRYAA